MNRCFVFTGDGVMELEELPDPRLCDLKTWAWSHGDWFIRTQHNLGASWGVMASDFVPKTYRAKALLLEIPT